MQMKRYGLTMLGALVLAGCSGESTTASKPITGVFIDGPVQGVKYVFGRYSGSTGVGGSYACEEGEVGEFRVGNIALGKAACAPVITILDLVKHENRFMTVGEAKAAANPAVQFLMSIGTVGSDGSITIAESASSRAAKESADPYLDAPMKMRDVARTITGNATLSYVDASTASNHLASSLATVEQARHAGEYVSSSWDGTSVADLVVKPNGEISGYLVVMNGWAYEMTGAVSSDGSFSLSVKSPATGLPVPSTASTGSSNGAGTLTGTSFNGTANFSYVLQRVTPATNTFYGIYEGEIVDSTYGGTVWGSCWFGIDATGKIYGFSSRYGGDAGSMFKGEVESSTGVFTITIPRQQGGSDTLTGTVKRDGTISDGTWHGTNRTGTFRASKKTLL